MSTVERLSASGRVGDERFHCTLSQAGLQPRDAVTVIWEATGEPQQVSALHRVIGHHKDHIEGTTKGPIVQRSSDSDLKDVMEIDEQKVVY